MQTTAPHPGAKPKVALTPNPGLTPLILNHAAWVTPDAAATTELLRHHQQGVDEEVLALERAAGRPAAAVQSQTAD